MLASVSAELDSDKLRAHQGLTYSIKRLARLLERTPNRFVAAHRDLHSARRALKVRKEGAKEVDDYV